MTAWCQEDAARYAGAVHGACPTERAGGEHVTGRGWHGADARERERQGVEGTTEEMGAGACTQTPGAPAAGRSAAATCLRDKRVLPHGDSAVPLMAPLTPALKSTINTSSSAEAALPNGESGAAVDGTAMPSSPVRPVVWLDVFQDLRDDNSSAG